MNNNIEAVLRGGQFKKLMENTMLVIKEKTGLKRVEIEVLYFLFRYPQQNTMKDICNHLQMNKGHISTVADGLTKQGYIIQQKDKKDRRYVHYTLTKKADDIVEHMTLAWEQMTVWMLKGISEEELSVFEKVSGMIENNIEQMLADAEWMK